MSDKTKQSVLEYVDTLKVKEPAKLYLKIKEHINEYGYEVGSPTPKPVIKITHIPEAVCESCE